jgi:hypothetical protein
MTKWIQINDQIFFYKELSVQTSIGSHSSSTLSIDMNQNAKAYDFFTKLYDSHFGVNGKLVPKKDIVFTVKTNNFELHGCLIKHIDFDFNSAIINLGIISDYTIMVDRQERRDEIIEQILNKTSEENNNIN